MALVHTDEATAVVALHGELDMATVDGLRGVTTQVVRSGYRTLVLDFADVRFMDSQGVRAVLDAHKAMLAIGGSLTLRNPGDAVCRVLEITGVDTIVTVEP